jgi:drug/metabolite transporter (DMT)-like permease
MRGEGGETAAHAHGHVYAGLVLTMVFWGSAFATPKMLVLEVPPEVGATLRFGIGSLLMMALLGERPTAPQGAGGALMLLGVWLVNRFGEGRMPLKGRGSPASP